MNDLLSYKLPNRESKVKIIHKDGTYKWIKTYAIKSRFEGFVRISCMDITENKLMEDELLKLKSNFDIIQNMAEIIVIDRLDGVFNWSYEFYNIFGREISKKESSTSHDLIYECILDNKKEYLNKIIKASENKEIFTFVFPFETEDFIIKYFKVWINFKYPHFAYETSFVGFIQDVSDEIKDKLQLENKLIENTSLLEELNQSLKDKKQLIIEKDQLLNDKSVLLKEVHHRVKNNLQIILSLINLDKRFKSDNPMSIITEIQGRINAMALIHEKIYLSESLSHVNMCEYIDSIVNSLFGLYNVNIGFKKDLDNIALDMDHAIPLGLIINELLNNVIKYAFPNNENGTLYISLKNIDSKIVLKFQDDGVGLPEDLDIYNSPSLGLTVVVNLCSQIGASFSKFDCDGTGFLIAFKD